VHGDRGDSEAQVALATVYEILRHAARRVAGPVEAHNPAPDAEHGETPADAVTGPVGASNGQEHANAAVRS
jgi:hypothetical protein